MGNRAVDVLRKGSVVSNGSCHIIHIDVRHLTDLLPHPARNFVLPYLVCVGLRHEAAQVVAGLVTRYQNFDVGQCLATGNGTGSGRNVLGLRVSGWTLRSLGASL
jgi:hypothetical protein